MNKKTISYIIQTVRPKPSIVSGLAAFVFLLIGGHISFSLALIQSMPMTMITMAGYVLNDLYDRKKDLKSGAEKPIAQGMLKRETALSLSVYLVVAALLLSVGVSGIDASYILLVTVVGVSIYSPLSMKFPFFKGFVTAVLCLSPFYYASTIANLGVPLYIYVATFVFIVGREILLDYKDLEKDLRNNLRTLPFYIGTSYSRTASWGLMFAGVVSLLLFFTSVVSISLIFVALIFLGISLYLDRNDEVGNAGLTIWTMVFCLLAVPFNF